MLVERPAHVIRRRPGRLGRHVRIAHPRLDVGDCKDLCRHIPQNAKHAEEWRRYGAVRPVEKVEAPEASYRATHQYCTGLWRKLGNSMTFIGHHPLVTGQQQAVGAEDPCHAYLRHPLLSASLTLSQAALRYA